MYDYAVYHDLSLLPITPLRGASVRLALKIRSAETKCKTVGSFLRSASSLLCGGPCWRPQARRARRFMEVAPGNGKLPDYERT